MKNGLLEKIQSVGHWRVNFRPLVPLGETLSFQQCSELVREHSVLIRGWDYPHIPKRQDDESGFGSGEGFYEGWCDWWGAPHRLRDRATHGGRFQTQDFLSADGLADRLDLAHL